MSGSKSFNFGDVFADSFNGAGTGLTDINLATAATVMAADSVVLTDALGAVTTAILLPTTRGGTGADLSGSTGGAQCALTNTDGTIATGPAIAQYGGTATTIPIRATGTGAIHNSAGFICDGLGSPAIPDREYAILRWDGGNMRYVLETVSTGTGILRPWYINAASVRVHCAIGGDLPAAAPEDFVRKSEFDAIASGVSWQPSVLEITAVPTLPAADGDRYVASANVPALLWVKDHIYQWNAAGGVWTDFAPKTGWACLVLGGAVYPDQTIIYTDSIPPQWSPMGISIDHYDLIHRGTNTHATIDLHLAETTTDPHAGQDLRSVATPTFTGTNLTGLLPALTWTNTTAPGPPLPGATALTLTAAGVLQYSRPDPGTTGVTGLDMQTGYIRAPLLAIPSGLAGIRIAPVSNVSVATYPLEVYGTTDSVLRLLRDGSLFEASFDILNATGELRVNTLHGAQITTRLGVGVASEDNVAIAARCTTGEQARLYYDATHYATLRTQSDGSFDITATHSPIRFGTTSNVVIQSTTASTLPANGSLQVGGGAGIAQNASIGAELRLFDITAPQTAYTRAWHDGATSYLDCSAVARTLNISANFARVNLIAATTSTSPTTGALVSVGGIGTGENFNLGGNLGIWSGANNFTMSHIAGILTFMPNFAGSGYSFARNTTGGDITIASDTEAGAGPIGSLKTSGGIFAGKRVYANAMTCLTAPATTTDVLRQADLNAFSLLRENPTGFPNRTDSTISFNNTGRLFTIAPVAASFTYYIAGIPYAKNAAESISISNVSGMHYIYYNGTTLSESTVFTDSLIISYALVASLYWNAVGSKIVILGDERHGLSMSPYTHRQMHYATGAAYKSGITPGGFTINTGSDGSNIDANAQFTISQGLILDEDIELTIADKTLITTPIRVLYLNGAVWDFTTSTGAFLQQTTRLYYNLNTGGVWSLALVTDGNYVLGHIIATNESIPCVILGQAQYTSQTSARTAASTEMRNIFVAGLPMAEFRVIATIIYRARTTYASTIKARVIEVSTGVPYVDWRGSSLTAASGTPASHSNLTNLTSDDHLQYFNVVGRPGEALTLQNNDGTPKGTTIATAPTAGTMVFTNYAGAGYQFALNGSGGNVSISSTTASSAYTNGALVVVGGAGFGGPIHSNSSIFLDNAASALRFSNVTTKRRVVMYEVGANDFEFFGFGIQTDQLRLQVASASSFFGFNAATSSSTDAEVLRIDGDVSTGAVRVRHTTASTSSSTGALIVAGGAGFGGDICTAGGIRMGNSANAYRQMRIGGGNNYGWIYGSYAALGDGIHVGYGGYYDSAGTFVSGGSLCTQISIGYNYFAVRTTTVSGTAPTLTPLNVSGTVTSMTIARVATAPSLATDVIRLTDLDTYTTLPGFWTIGGVSVTGGTVIYLRLGNTVFIGASNGASPATVSNAQPAFTGTLPVGYRPPDTTYKNVLVTFNASSLWQGWFLGIGSNGTFGVGLGTVTVGLSYTFYSWMTSFFV